jgi:hypothetical protein
LALAALDGASGVGLFGNFPTASLQPFWYRQRLTALRVFGYSEIFPSQAFSLFGIDSA